MKINSILKGTLILTIAGVASRFLGFFYRIYLTKMIGSEGLGLYQMVFPLTAVCMSIAGSGISVAISKYTASYTATGCEKKARDTMLTGTLLSVLTAIVCSAILYTGAEFIATVIFKDSRFAMLIKIISFSIPLSVIHNNISSYYMGRSNPVIPAVSQILEQLVRIAGIYILFTIHTSKNLPVSAATAVYAILFGEIASCLFCMTLIRLGKSDFKIEQPVELCRRIYKIALPISINRITLSVLHSLEAILIPALLGIYGLSKSECISTYGILTGMAFPLIMLPSTLINSFSELLLPAVSKAASQKKSKKLNHTIFAAYRYSLEIGIFCLAVFYNYGSEMGVFLFDETEVGTYVRAFAWMCPFLYISTTFTSILNGLGKTKQTLFMDITSFLLRIFLNIILIPRMGITGYMIAFLVSEVYLALSYIVCVKKINPVFLSFGEFILRPSSAIILSLFLTRLFKVFWNFDVVSSSLFLSMLVPCCIIFLLYFTILYILFPFKSR
jgi:stage V sporulation protein B